MAVALDAGRGAAERAPPVGADDEAGGDAVPALKRDVDRKIRVSCTAVASSSIAQQRWKLLCAFVERGEKMIDSRCCGRTHRARSRTPRNKPPARERGAASHRQSASRASAQHGQRIRPRLRGCPARSPSPPAARWCDGPAPVAARSMRFRRRPGPGQSRRSARPDRRRRSPPRRLIASVMPRSWTRLAAAQDEGRKP